MSRQPSHAVRAALIWLGCIVGCGSATGPRPVAVSGKVATAAGKPCDGALVVLHPRAADRVNAAKPVATAAEDGTFRLTTAKPDDGAIPGEYGVTVVWPERAAPGKMSLSSEGGGGGRDRLGGRYGNPGQPKITVTIPPEGEKSLTITVDAG
jgi:hypothetical protein